MRVTSAIFLRDEDSISVRSPSFGPAIWLGDQVHIALSEAKIDELAEALRQHIAERLGDDIAPA